MAAGESRPNYLDIENTLRSRLDVLRGEIGAALFRAGAETYGELAGQVHDIDEESLADLLSDVNLAEISRQVREVRDIDAAMRRIAGRTYGVCVECGEPIDAARLRVYPTAVRCLGCQQAQESRPPAKRPPKL